MIIWNPWHGCHKVSEGCQHCYMYFLDGKRGIDTSKVYRTENFNLPVQTRRDGRFKLPSGMQLYVGLSTDFFVEEADEWRDEAWRIIRQRPDIVFRLLTKRANRIKDCLPKDWGDGYENVLLQVTTENQQRADERLPILLDIPAKHKGFMAAPFIGEVDAEKYLATGQIEEVLCGGENYDGARPCHYEWVKKLSDQCRKHNVTFDFIETGTVFVKEGKTILLDAGLGAPFSQLIPKLNEEGVNPDSLKLIYITHMHGDHIGGLLRDGAKVFPNAELWINRVEVEAWKAMDGDNAALPKAVLEAYKDNLKLFEAGDTLSGGVSTIAAYGHTPGHTVFQKDSILVISDLMHGAALQLKHPEYCPFFDMNPEEATASRKRILEYAKKNNLTMYGMHIPEGVVKE